MASAAFNSVPQAPTSSDDLCLSFCEISRVSDKTFFVQITNFVSYIREIFAYGSLKIQNFVCLISIRIWLESLAWRPTAGRQKLWCSPAAGKQLPRCWRRRVVTEEKAKVVAIIFLDPDSKEIILNPDSQLSLSWSGSLSENLIRPQ